MSVLVFDLRPRLLPSGCVLDGNKAGVLRLGVTWGAGMDWAGLGWVGWGYSMGRNLLGKNKRRDRQDRLDRGNRGAERKATFPLPSPKRQRQLLCSQRFSTTLHFFYGFAFFFSSLFCSPSLIFSCCSRFCSLSQSPFSIAGLTMNGYIFVWSFLSCPRLVSLCPSTYLPTYIPRIPPGKEKWWREKGGGKV